LLASFILKNKIASIAVLNGTVHNLQKYITRSNPQTASAKNTQDLDFVYTSGFGDLYYTKQRLEHSSIHARLTVWTYEVDGQSM
jgi:hypothetical protein